jgi:hypothetical protein
MPPSNQHRLNFSEMLAVAKKQGIYTERLSPGKPCVSKSTGQAHQSIAENQRN